MALEKKLANEFNMILSLAIPTQKILIIYKKNFVIQFVMSVFFFETELYFSIPKSEIIQQSIIYNLG